MTERVRLSDGLRIDLATGETVVADATQPAGDINVLSHAHGDHLYREAPPELICSETTAALARTRRDEADYGELNRTTHPAVDLVNAGHVAGSRAALIEDEAAGRTYLYTGDVSTRDRCYLSGFEPPDADVLITETTYGSPEFVLPPQNALEREIVDWLDDTTDRPVLLFGYSLGRAQKLQRLVARSGRSRLFVSDAIARINEPIEVAFDVAFGAERSSPDVDLEAGDALVLPSQTNNLAFVDRIVDETGATKAGFSGWAVESSFKYRGDYDVTFPLSDHCDFTELEAVVEAVDPEVVYTHHGSAETFATHCTAELGYEARALKRDQATLGEF